MRWIAVLALGSTLGGCAAPPFPSSTGRDTDLVPADGLIEIGLDRSFAISEIEFHVAATALPEAVLAAVEELMPGGEITGCEKEYHGRRLLWEVTKTVAGKEMEVLFEPGGRVVDQEIEIDAADAPGGVIDTAKNAVGGGTLTKIEEIRDAGRQLRRYHVKLTREGVRYKISVAPDGRLETVYRETKAEVEVPLR